MSAFVDRNGLSQSRGISAALRTHGKNFGLEIVRCHSRFLAGDHERLDAEGRSHYATSFGIIVFALPKAPPWFAVVSLPQELTG